MPIRIALALLLFITSVSAMEINPAKINFVFNNLSSGTHPIQWAQQQGAQWYAEWHDLDSDQIPTKESLTENNEFVGEVWSQLDPSFLPGDEFAAIDYVKNVISNAWNIAFNLKYPPPPTPTPTMSTCMAISINIDRLENSIARLRHRITGYIGEIYDFTSMLNSDVHAKSEHPENDQNYDICIIALNTWIQFSITYIQSDQAMIAFLTQQLNAEKARYAQYCQ